MRTEIPKLLDPVDYEKGYRERMRGDSLSIIGPRLVGEPAGQMQAKILRPE